ncbi:hypothetical protein F5B22DRAFT_378582 [Xylaria bambusicola]|uniref:uncharacterized protein n=1 Tax=Xylaria bambusicola TaxID=326684 RepID=UPI002007DFEE|nr:uncharacterized protein F5B22DRAFT_378582 [Xylaria bambusicola]KAI0508864.1 hypothetical protein F5B22DRAFT_378582 [Xylaria bambusicola]
MFSHQMWRLLSCILLQATRVLVGAATPIDPFGLYAYGPGISGARVFYSNELAFIGNQTQIDDEEAASVLFNKWGPNNELIANPEGGSSPPSWSNKAFYIPAARSPSHDVGFTLEPDTDMDTSGFIFYGATMLHASSGDNNLRSLWYAVPTRYEKVWSLQWNTTGDGHVAVTLRKVPPARPFRDLEDDVGMWLQA